LTFLLDTFEIKRKKTVLFSIPFENNVFEVRSYTESGSICWEYVEYQLLRKLYRWPAQKFSQLPVGGAFQILHPAHRGSYPINRTYFPVF